MGTSLRYALYHFKNTLIRLAVMIIYAIVTVNFTFHKIYGLDTHDFSFYIFAVNICLLAFIVAIMEFAPLKNRRNLDSWFSFPISRPHLVLVHALNGAAQLFIVHTISVIWAVAKAVPFIEKCHLQMHIMGVMYAELLIVGLLYYGLLMFPVLLANNVVDSVLLSIFYVVLPFPIVSFFDSITDMHLLTTDDELWFGLPAILTVLAGHNDTFLMKNYYDSLGGYAQVKLSSGDIAVIAIWCAVGAALAVLSVVIFANKKTEKYGGPSDHICAYRLCIPIFMITIVLLNGGDPGIGSLYAIGTYLLYVIFRRSAKIKIPDIVITAIVLVLGNLPVDYMEVLGSIF